LRLHDEIHVTSVFMTRDQEEAFEVADRVVIMSKGKIEQVGSPAEIFEHPANPFMMDFLGNVDVFRVDPQLYSSFGPFGLMDECAISQQTVEGTVLQQELPVPVQLRAYRFRGTPTFSGKEKDHESVLLGRFQGRSRRAGHHVAGMDRVVTA